MRSTADRHAMGAITSCVALIVSSMLPLSGHAEEQISLTINQDILSHEMRKAIVEAIAPDSALSDLLRLSEPAIIIGAIPDAQIRDPLVSILEMQNGLGDESTDSVIVTTVKESDYVLVSRTSDIANRLGLEERDNQDVTERQTGHTAGESQENVVETTKSWAIPFNSSETSSNELILPPSGLTVPVSVAATEADPILHRIDNELRKFGSSTVFLPATEDNRLLAFKMQSIPTTDVEVSIIEGSGPLVKQDLPEGVELLNASSGSCESSGENWPTPIPAVREILEHNKHVLERMAVSHPLRSRTLIVDSGVSQKLVNHIHFAKFLRPDLSSALRRGYYWNRVTDIDGAQICDAKPGLSSLGHVSNSVQNLCYAMLPGGGLEPPKPKLDVINYLPSHGGFVAILAAGGLDLIKDDSLSISENIAIGFSRVMSVENGSLHSNYEDILDTIDYADSEDYNVLNLSLSFTHTGLTEVHGAIKCFLNGGDGCKNSPARLIVAAAGNASSVLTQSSRSFPASIAAGASFSSSGALLIVGGVELQDGKLAPWAKSNYHNDLVDILAPSSSVISLDENGSSTCLSGTSVAAPQVSFVAGMLFSLGYESGQEVRNRILATATINGAAGPNLSDRAKEGRVLNVAAALDVYSDLIYVKQSDADPVMLRGQLKPEMTGVKGVMIQLCNADDPALQGDAGRRDADQFVAWRSISHETAEVWAVGFQINRNNRCVYDPDAMVHFRAYGDDTSKTYKLSQIARIVPSQFRRVFE